MYLAILLINCIFQWFFVLDKLKQKFFTESRLHYWLAYPSGRSMNLYKNTLAYLVKLLENLKMEKPKFPNLLILEHLKSHFIKSQLTEYIFYVLWNQWVKKTLNWPFWGFSPSPLTYTTLIAVKTFFVVKTPFITHKFTLIYIIFINIHK